MAMLEREQTLTLDSLNQATQARVEQDYHRTHHSEIDATPLDRYLAGPNVRRECPDTATLSAAFRIEVARRQRRAGGMVSLEGSARSAVLGFGRPDSPGKWRLGHQSDAGRK